MKKLLCSSVARYDCETKNNNLINMLMTLSKYTSQFILICFVSLVAIGITHSAEENSNIDFEKTVKNLAEGSYSERAVVIAELVKIDDVRVLPVFEVLRKNKLYYIKETKHIVFTTKTDEGYQAVSVIDKKNLGIFPKNKLKKVKVNNKLRRILRGYVAQLSLKSTYVTVRKAAVQQMLKNINEDSIATLKELNIKEKNAAIKEYIAAGMAVWDLNSDDKKIKLAAIETLATSLLPEVKVKLEEIIEETKDSDIKKAAKSAMKTIDSKISMFGFLENLVFGLSLGSVLLLIAVGLAITFGVMGVINMAHGELMMLGAYTTYVVQQMLPDYITASIFISIPLAFLVAGAFGVAIERFVIRYLYGRPLETLLATFGISLILQQLVRSIFGPTNQAVETPAFMSGSLEINSIFAITYNRLYIFIFAIVVLLLLMLILKKTRLGLQVRAVSQNRTMAKAMGVKSEWVDAMTFGLGSGIAGVAGVALSQLTNVGPNLGQGYIIDSFMVVVFGGVGNLLGTFVGAMSLGVFNKFLEPWSGAVLAKILVLIFIILFIQKRPRGLFPKKGRGVED